MVQYAENVLLDRNNIVHLTFNKKFALDNYKLIGYLIVRFQVHQKRKKKVFFVLFLKEYHRPSNIPCAYKPIAELCKTPLSIQAIGQALYRVGFPQDLDLITHSGSGLIRIIRYL
ncbi:hypothetical protein PHYBLDRAFT_70196 [Phycomyces blakesleeanus NRRL 1555(-)]|uniref:Uncharacterized protein n=1 Tax=Phycomyces blakesleeanus (strain ATCC 8743b / DSM 1359 / FGSC 10004 / NBRC 33097 / NRRL 1555) TaxID=763407 RepID=A0A162ZHL4_PHYB8|nr:hypothetical protein PHYBLDRAFT_70196 [Phycomyces blakesleeanus NRRL 1555(-)]OAD66811.1 hypothetical protein PHYBLDRAFT_70196 [Phycomyces blakesleeanus NRRL 1555(-)]|eukprot:XP_018284851.1 hypothetical protein PHYBLDRAFT_70196 [Phycomyces blakesleeanus NRRL 1555(-)]